MCILRMKTTNNIRFSHQNGKHDLEMSSSNSEGLGASDSFLTDRLKAVGERTLALTLLQLPVLQHLENP